MCSGDRIIAIDEQADLDKLSPERFNEHRTVLLDIIDDVCSPFAAQRREILELWNTSLLRGNWETEDDMKSIRVRAVGDAALEYLGGRTGRHPKLDRQGQRAAASIGRATRALDSLMRGYSICKCTNEPTSVPINPHILDARGFLNV